ncbi:MAG: hypothetical protein MUC48_02315 [Leptolyngbya sp. Prado105]|nr:hypothetical protein [Leptolyngbya sp. Prado105]
MVFANSILTSQTTQPSGSLSTEVLSAQSINSSSRIVAQSTPNTVTTQKKRDASSPAAVLGIHGISSNEQIAASESLRPQVSSEAQAIPVESPQALPPLEEIQDLEQELNSFQEAFSSYRASPGITIANPSGFGADRNRLFVSIGAQRTRIASTDGAAGFGIGLGNAQRFVGIQLSYTLVSVTPQRGDGESIRPFGSGAFNVKIHRQFSGGWSAAIGAEGIFNIGKLGNSISPAEFNEFEDTYYGAVTHLIRLKQDANRPFSRLALTLGAGTGRFRTLEQLIDGGTFVNPFASIALKVSPSTSLIAEWTGQDLGVGLSIVPFRNLPLILTPAIRDLAGPDAEKPRFIFGVGLSL